MVLCPCEYESDRSLVTGVMLQVSHALAKAITRMVRAGVRRDSLWVVAHSLGGQLAGVTAKDLDFKLPRITGEP